jgi:hypothetical protein
MDNKNWWQQYQQYAKTLERTGKKTSPALITGLNSATELFSALKQRQGGVSSLAPGAIQSEVGSVRKLIAALRVLERHTRQDKTRLFYGNFAASVEQGLQELERSLRPTADSMQPTPKKQAKTNEKPEPPLANRLGDRLYPLQKAYVPLMQARHDAQAQKGATGGVADEADRLESFLDICEHWLKHLYALDYAVNVLRTNLEDQQTPVVQEPLPLQFRLERNKPGYTIRLIKASYRNPTADDITILDVIDTCHQLRTFDREGKTLIDDPEVIRFIRLHSVKDNLLQFRDDDLCRLAAELYQILVEAVVSIRKLAKAVIDLIKRTPMQDLDYAFTGINPEECRLLLRQKFQTMLPGINEDRYRTATKKRTGERAVRTVEITEAYRRNFEETRQSVLGSPKSTLAMFHWLRKALTMVVRNNQALQRQATEKANRENGSGIKTNELETDFQHWLLVGTSLTIGEDDIADFYISPDDIISSQMSIQRVDRTDKWIAVRKSEKLHRIRKQDFFRVVNTLIDTDLNPALKRYGFRPVDLKQQLLPEIQERLGDAERIEVLRSGILGTIITNLDEFRQARDFHTTFRRYFRKPDYDNTHYPDRDKLRQLATGLAFANTSILQMKYRRVLRVIQEIETELKTPTGSNTDTGADLPTTQALEKIIRKVREILVFAKPSLKDVRLEVDQDYVVVREFSRDNP